MADTRSTNRLSPTGRDKKSFSTTTYTYVQELSGTDLTGNDGGGFSHSQIFDLTEARLGCWSVLIIPTGGSVEFTTKGIYELDADDEPDADKTITRQAATVVAAPNIEVVQLDEVIPYLVFHFTLAGLTATSVKIVVAVGY